MISNSGRSSPSSTLAGCSGRIAQRVEAGDFGQAHQHAEVERAGDFVDLFLGQIELLPEQRQQLLGCRGFDFEPDRVAPPAAAYLAFDHFQVRAAAFVIELELRVAGETDHRRIENHLAGEELRELRANHVLEQDVRLTFAAGDLDQPREAGRHLHDRETARGFIGRGLEQERQIQAERGEQRERPRHVDGQRRQDGQHRLAEERAERGAAGIAEVGERHDSDALRGERRQQLFVDQAIQGAHEGVRSAADCGQLLGGGQARRIAGRFSLFNRPLDGGGADHEELVEIRRSDRRELHPLEQRRRRVGRFLQDALVERDPRELAIDEQCALLAHDTTPAGRITSCLP